VDGVTGGGLLYSVGHCGQGQMGGGAYSALHWEFLARGTMGLPPTPRVTNS